MIEKILWTIVLCAPVVWTAGSVIEPVLYEISPIQAYVAMFLRIVGALSGMVCFLWVILLKVWA